MSYKLYKKNTNISFAIGVYPTLELIQNKKEYIKNILIKSGSEQENAGIKKVLYYAKTMNINYEFATKKIELLSGKENEYCIAYFYKYSEKIQSKTNHLVLVNPSDPGNIGTIIRTMHAFNFSNLAIVGTGSSDIFNPKVTRASMGSLFSIKHQYFSNFAEYQNQYPTKKHFSFYTDGEKNLLQINDRQNISIIFGNESSGLPKEIKKSTNTVYIPISKNVDSLNLSISAGIALNHFYKK